MKINYLIFQVHGKETFFHEALYALISFYKFHRNSNIKIVIYTDNSVFFKKYLPEKNVLYFDINAEKIKEWRGEIDFVHRVKIKTIQNFVNQYPGNYLYLDTDIVFDSNIDYIFEMIENGALFLENFESELYESKSRIMKKAAFYFSENQNLKTKEDSEFIILKKPFNLYNAGAIGFNSEYIFILDKALAFTDLIYPELQSHITEQLSFCYYFQKEKKVNNTNKSIVHYWFFKKFGAVLKDFFNTNASLSLDELILEYHKIDPRKLFEEMLKYKKLNFFQKILKRIKTGKKW